MPDPADDDKSTSLPLPEPLVLEEDRMSSPVTIVAELAEGSDDDVIAVLSALTPADMNMELILDHLTTSNDLFSSPHLDLSALPNGVDDHG
jgi:hypothetical protein